jgi:hypothetical protein
VGFHRTGSTWLQRGLFVDERAGFRSPWTTAEISQALVRVDPFRFDAAAVAAGFEPGIAAAGAAGLVPVVSHERLSGNPHAGAHDAGPICDRLAAVFPGARVLIVIREQVSMVVSNYKQYVKVGGPASLAGYVAPVRKGRDRVPRFDLRQFEYDAFVERYRQAFGPSSVLVLPFEQLRRDREGFATAIARFAGACGTIDEVRGGRDNVAFSALSTALKRRLNLVLVRDATNPNAPVDDPSVNEALMARLRRLDRRVPGPVHTRFEDRLRREAELLVGDRFRESNARTAELTGLPLAELGYGC